MIETQVSKGIISTYFDKLQRRSARGTVRP